MGVVSPAPPGPVGVASKNIQVSDIIIIQKVLNQYYGYTIYVSILLTQRGICFRVCPEWPAMPCMEWLPALAYRGNF